MVWALKTVIWLKKKRGRKPKVRRKEAKELEQIVKQARKKKIPMTGGYITCSLYSMKGHNKPFHKDEGSTFVAENVEIHDNIESQAPAPTQPSQSSVQFILVTQVQVLSFLFLTNLQIG